MKDRDEEVTPFLTFDKNIFFQCKKFLFTFIFLSWILKFLFIIVLPSTYSSMKYIVICKSAQYFLVIAIFTIFFKISKQTTFKGI